MTRHRRVAALVAFLVLLPTVAFSQDYGKLLKKKCFPATWNGRPVIVCYFQYEKADVWTRDGQPYAYLPMTEKERKQFAALNSQPTVAEQIYIGA